MPARSSRPRFREQHQLPAQAPDRARDVGPGLAGQRRDDLAHVLLGARQFGAGGGVERMQAVVAPGRAVGAEDHAAAVGQHDRVLAAGPGALEFVERDLDHHHARHWPAGAAVAVHRLGDEVAGFAGIRADAVEAAGASGQRLAEIRTVGEILADPAARLVEIAGRDGEALAVEQVERADLGLALDRLQHQVGARHHLGIAGLRQRLGQLALLAEHEGQRLEALQQRLQVGRHQLELAPALFHQVLVGAGRAELEGAGDQAGAGGEAEQEGEDVFGAHE